MYDVYAPQTCICMYVQVSPSPLPTPLPPTHTPALPAEKERLDRERARKRQILAWFIFPPPFATVFFSFFWFLFFLGEGEGVEGERQSTKRTLERVFFFFSCSVPVFHYYCFLGPFSFDQSTYALGTPFTPFGDIKAKPVTKKKKKKKVPNERFVFFRGIHEILI